MSELIPILLITVCLPLWIIFHYITKMKTSKGDVTPKGQATYPDPTSEKVANAIMGVAGQLSSQIQSTLMIAKAQTRMPDLKVDILAHSNGGLLARYYARYGTHDHLDHGIALPSYAGATAIRRLLMVGTPNLGSMQPVLSHVRGEEMGLRKIPAEVVATIESVMQQKNNRLHVEVDPSLGAIRADLTKVRQALFNLLSNACKFTNNGTISVSAHRRSGADGDRVVFVLLLALVDHQGQPLFEEDVLRIVIVGGLKESDGRGVVAGVLGGFRTLDDDRQRLILDVRRFGRRLLGQFCL